MATTLIIGCGYVGEKVAIKLKKQDPDHILLATTGSSERAAHLTSQGITTLAINLDKDGLSELMLPRAPYRLLYLVPPPAYGQEDTRLQRVLKELQTKPPVHLVYLGTSGIYGNCQGAWVDESSSPNPTSLPSKRRFHAEHILGSWCPHQGCSLTLLRVSAIYGPERLPIKRILEGRPVVNPDEAVLSNRVHIDDLTTVCIKTLDRQGTNEIFNVSDGHPTTSFEYFKTVAHALGMPSPPTISLNEALFKASSTERIYLTESRRLNNRKLIEKLDLNFRFPTIQSAMEQLRPK